MKKIPEISSNGSLRTLLAPLKDFEFDMKTDEEDNIAGIFTFSLQAGSYATVAMREFIDEEK